MMISNCVGNCWQRGPPPNNILSMPPPPLPSFLLPKTAVISLPANDSYPCFAAFMCDFSPHPRESGMEFIEIVGSNNTGLANTWLFVLSSSFIGVLILGGLLAIILLKCRDCNFSYHDSNIKQGTLSTLSGPSKANSFMAGGILYPCTTAENRDILQNQLANDNRLLWATLTPHGTRHFISDYPIVHQDRAKPENTNMQEYTKRTPSKSFDNSGFVDYDYVDYEDPTPLMDSYHDDLDSGYQEPQEILGSLQRGSARPLVSSPTKIDNPNIPPLNVYPHRTNNLQSNNTTSTMNRKKTLSRRISDTSLYSGGSM